MTLANSLQPYRYWSLLFVPCLLWSCLPPWPDLCLVTTFVMSQVLFYSLQNVRGMLILSTLVLLLWTKSVVRRWYRSQVLTSEFFKNLLYIALTVALSLAAVVVVWMPLYEAYTCVVNKTLDKNKAHVAMEWRNTIFLVIGASLAISSITQTDLVLRSNQVDNSGLLKALRTFSKWLYRVARVIIKEVISVLTATIGGLELAFGGFRKDRKTWVAKYAAYDGAAGSGGEDKAAGGGESERGVGHTDDVDSVYEDVDIMTAFQEQGSSRPVVAERRLLGTQKMDRTKTWSSDVKKGNSPDPPSRHHKFQAGGSTRRLRSLDRKMSMASDPQPGPSSAVGKSQDSGRLGRAQVKKMPFSDYVSPTTTKKSSRSRPRKGVGRDFQSPAGLPTAAADNTNPSGLLMKRAQPDPASDRTSVTDTASQLLQQCVTPTLSSDTSLTDTTSQLLQQCVTPTPFSDHASPTSALIKKSSRSRARKGMGRDFHSPADLPTAVADYNTNLSSLLMKRAPPDPASDGTSLTDTTSQLLQRCVTPTLPSDHASPTSTLIKKSSRSRAKRGMGRDLQSTADLPTAAADYNTNLSSLLMKRAQPDPASDVASLTDTTSCLLQQCVTPTLSSDTSLTDTTSQLLQQCVTPTPFSDHAPPTAIGKSSRSRTRKAMGRDFQSPADLSTAVADYNTNLSSLLMKRALPDPASDGTSLTDTTSQLLQQCMTPTLSSDTSLTDTTSQLLQQCLTPTPNTHSSNRGRNVESPSPDHHQLWSAPQNNRTRSWTMGRAKATTSAQSDSSLDTSLTGVLQRCARPAGAPLTRHQARLMPNISQRTQAHNINQKGRIHAHNGHAEDTNPSNRGQGQRLSPGTHGHVHNVREKSTRSAKSPNRWCPDCY